MTWEVVAALLVGVALVWVVWQPLVRPGSVHPAVLEPPDQDDTPRGRAVAALREIEFDRETGKLSDADYEALKAKYTAIALAAGRAGRVDAGPDLEALVAARVRAIRGEPGALEAPACSDCGPRPETQAAFCSTCGRRLPTGSACARCSAPLADGSAFCERCGARVAA